MTAEAKSETVQEKTGLSIKNVLARALLVVFVSLTLVYFMSHFPFGRIEYIYQGY